MKLFYPPETQLYRAVWCGIGLFHQYSICWKLMVYEAISLQINFMELHEIKDPVWLPCQPHYYLLKISVKPSALVASLKSYLDAMQQDAVCIRPDSYMDTLAIINCESFKELIQSAMPQFIWGWKNV